MPGPVSRRKLVRRAALLVSLPALGKMAAGCARRIGLDRTIEVGTPVDGDVLVPRGAAPELARKGGAVIVRPPGSPLAYLVVNTGNGFNALQAECPHEGCALAWVPEDLQAECPCHGSRFAGDGSLLSPPARSDLSAYPAEADAQGNVTVHLFAGDGTFKNPVANGQFSFALADFPALQNVGGAVTGRPDGFPTPLVITRLSAATDATAIAALSSICTHLGCSVLPSRCTPSPTCAPLGIRLQCPCHGSNYAIDGTLTLGPAGASLPRYQASFDGATVTVSTQLAS